MNSILSHLVGGVGKLQKGNPDVSMSCSLQVKLLNSSIPGEFSQTVFNIYFLPAPFTEVNLSKFLCKRNTSIHWDSRLARAS